MSGPLCPACKSSRVRSEPCPTGPHHAKLLCAACGVFRGWATSPAPPADEFGPELAAECAARIPNPALSGTTQQVKFAESLRASMLARAIRAADFAAIVAIKATVDATWFIGNQDRPLSALRAPNPGQLAPLPEAAGPNNRITRT